MKSFILLFTVFISLTLKAQNTTGHSQEMKKTTSLETTKKESCTYSIIPSVQNTWGYDIFMGKQLLIHQPCVPGLSGNKGFQDKITAEKAAKLATKKITNAVIIYPETPNAPSQSGNTWIQKTEVGGLARYGAVGFSIGSKGYIGLGNPVDGIDFLNDFWEYDTTSNAWTQKADFGGSGREWAVGFSIGDKGYVGTGTDGVTNFSDFWEYDPAANMWTQKADFAGGARRNATGFSIGSKGYIGTGNPENDFYRNDFWEYDPATNNWTQKADVGGSGRVGATAFSIGNKGYIGTGYTDTGNFFADDFWEYDPSADTWTQKADFGGTGRNSAVGFCIGSRGYLGTGSDLNYNYVNDFWEYDPYTDTWTQKADFGGGNRGAAVGFSIGDKGYIGTGNNTSFEQDFWVYYQGCITPNPPTNTTPLSNQNICTGNSTTLSASGQGNLGWYTAATGGTWLGGGSDYATPLLTTDTTYYVQDSTCGASPARTGITVTVDPLPDQPGLISGATHVCAGDNDVMYSVEPVANATEYIWSLPPGASISSGGGTNIIVNFDTNAVSGNISVYATNQCGNGINSPDFSIAVNPVPLAPVITNNGDTLFSNVHFGNQWYYEGMLLSGDTSQTCIAINNGYYWDAITLNGCPSEPSNHIMILNAGVHSHPTASIKVYPVPSDGRFIVYIPNSSKEPYSISIYNSLGILIYEQNTVDVNSSDQKIIDLRPIPAGVYILTYGNSRNQEVKKIIVNK